MTNNLVLDMYRGEPCRICGKLIGDDKNPIYAGYSQDNKSRAAHEKCWESKPDKKQWAFPFDEN